MWGRVRQGKAQKVDLRKEEDVQRSQSEVCKSHGRTAEWATVPALGFRRYLVLPKSSLLYTLSQEPTFLLRCSFCTDIKPSFLYEA